MIETKLMQQLVRIGQRLRCTKLFAWLGLVWLAGAVVGGGLLLAGRNTEPVAPWTASALTVVVLTAAIAIVWRLFSARVNLLDTARRIEVCYPDLDARLLAAVEQRREAGQSRLSYLQTEVVCETVAHGMRDGWRAAAPRGRLLAAFSLQAICLALFGLVLFGLSRESHAPAGTLLVDGSRPTSAGPRYRATIEPGDTELERGTSLLVLARFEGELPGEVALVPQSADGSSERLTMSKSLDDPVFAGRVSSVQQDLTYHVEFGGERSPAYRVTVFDYPELERSDIKLAFPAYTGQEETLVEDTRQVTAVEGTRLTLIARLNKDVAKAELAGDDLPSIELAADPDQKHAYTAAFYLEKTARYKLQLVDAQGRKNKQPIEFSFTAIPNRRPDIKLVFPARDVQVSPLEEIELHANVWDDFGLLAYGIAFSLDGQAPQEVVLGGKSAAKERIDVRHMMSFEQLKTEPDQVLSYYFFADDAAPDGSVRRTLSDMYFCEVRPFEEIFRQGEQPPGGSSQQQQQQGSAAEQAEKLADLQKQIISATWKLIRRETGAAATADYAKDATAVQEGQQDAIAMADELEEKLKDAQSRKHLDAARKHMRTALDQLKQAADASAVAPLTPALAAEQAAYQALLKLRAREHQVVRGSQQSSSSRSSSSQRSSQQLSQLELKNTENRYEEQRAANQQEDAAQRETRQVLNRLRELAQRQEDLNERIKEMQSALEEAKNEQEKEEIRRQLKRLRDEEQQILRDADELRDRMDQPENQQRMADAKQQLDQTRNNVRQASEALQAGQASQAAAAGERAEQQLQNLRDDFRKQASGRFNEEVRQMRDDARQLEKNQQELGQKLADLDQPKTKSLRESSGREQVREGLQQQKADLDKLLDQMRQTVEDAESSEPLLSKQLYDAIRQTRQQRPDEALDATRQLLERGFVEPSRQAEQKAQAGISQLKEGVERAAESVLGDETEAIRRARDQVDQLARAVDEELRRATGQGAEPARQDQANQPGQSNAQAGEAKATGNRSGQQQSGQGEPMPKEGAGQQGQQPNSPNSKAQGNQPSGQQQPGQPKQGDAPSKQGQSGDSKQGQPGDSKQGQPGGAKADSKGQAGTPNAQGQPNSPAQGGDQNQPSQPGNSQGQQPGSPGQPKTAGQSKGGQPGQPQAGTSQAGNPQGGNPQAGARNEGNPNGAGGVREFLDAAGGFTGPLTGGDFRPWSDRMRDVEEMINDPRLRAEAAAIRDRAGAMRAEFKRHSKEPNWELVRETISKPLNELRDRLAEELLRRQSKDALVPLDRDPVPPKYSEQVRRYYERLGSGQ